MQRTEPVGTSMLDMTRARQVAYLCSWQCTSISVSSLHPLQKCALSFQLCLFHCLSFSILLHGFERFLDVSIHLYVCAFLPFFLTQVFTPFHICASLFSASFCSSFLFSLQFSFIPSFRALVSSPSSPFTVFGRVHTFICLRFFTFFPHTSFYAFSHLRIPFFCFLLFLLFIFITVFLYPIFPRTCFIALNFILLRASFDATISLPVSVFVSILAQRQASYNLYTSILPRIVVIMLILTTLGWCPLNVISSKISAFLSADFQ